MSKQIIRIECEKCKRMFNIKKYEHVFKTMCVKCYMEEKDKVKRKQAAELIRKYNNDPEYKKQCDLESEQKRQNLPKYGRPTYSRTTIK